MKLFILVISFLTLNQSASICSDYDDIYLIFYLSKDGKTGHVGMAVDNYRIKVNEDLSAQFRYDTVANSTVTYFDLWGPDNISFSEHHKNLDPRYYRLPRSSAEAKLNPDYFLTKGLPHAYNYPCDAFIRIKTDPSSDYKMIDIADMVMEQFYYFNTREYNCADFIIKCLEKFYGVPINAKEFIPFRWSSTPNSLFREVKEVLDVIIIKDPGQDAERSFFKERIIKSF